MKLRQLVSWPMYTSGQLRKNWRIFDHCSSGNSTVAIYSLWLKCQQNLVTEAGVHLIMVFGTLGLLFSLDIKLTLVILPFIFLLAAAMHIFRQVVKGSSLHVRNRLGSLATLATETLSGVGVVKAFCMEKAELHRFSEQSLDILQANLRLARLQGFYNSTVEILLVGSTVVVVWLAAPQVLAQEMTVGALVAYLSYLTRFQDPLKGLSNANFRIQKA